MPLKPVQRESTEYEFDIVASINMECELVAQKTRCPALKGRAFKEPGEDVAAILTEWLTGEPAPPPPPSPTSPATDEQIARLLDCKLYTQHFGGASAHVSAENNKQWGIALQRRIDNRDKLQHAEAASLYDKFKAAYRVADADIEQSFSDDDPGEPPPESDDAPTDDDVPFGDADDFRAHAAEPTP